MSFFIALSGLIFLFIVFWRFKYLQSSLGGVLLLAGATGNFIDRVLWGYVTDWIYMGIYINIADILLCVGGLLFIISLGRRSV